MHAPIPMERASHMTNKTMESMPTRSPTKCLVSSRPLLLDGDGADDLVTYIKPAVSSASCSTVLDEERPHLRCLTPPLSPSMGIEKARTVRSTNAVSVGSFQACATGVEDGGRCGSFDVTASLHATDEGHRRGTFACVTLATTKEAGWTTPPTGLLLQSGASQRRRKARGGAHARPMATSADAPSAATPIASTRTPACASGAAARCEAARGFAAQWLSHLMQHPPEAEHIDLYRARLAKEQAVDLPQPIQLPPAAVCGTHTPDVPHANGPSPSTAPPTTSFLEVVLANKGKPKPLGGGSLRSTPLLPPPKAAATGGGDSARLSPSLPGVEVSVSSPLQLMPKSISCVPDLLHALREVALSCASLETVSLTSARHCGEAHVNKGKRGDGRPSKAATTAPPNLPSHPFSDKADEELQRKYESEWDTVRGHLSTIRRLVINSMELDVFLDSALGSDWRLTVGEGLHTPPSPPCPTGITAETLVSHNAPPFLSREASLVEHEKRATPSMQRLSETSTYYSPSQHIACFLERTTPPPRSTDATCLFPATPELNGSALRASEDLLLTPAPSEEPKDHSAQRPVAPPSATTAGSPVARFSSPGTAFHLESREDMLRRRSAAPNAFYASLCHGGSTSYHGGGLPSASAASTANYNASFSSGGTATVATTRSLNTSPMVSYATHPPPVQTTFCPFDYVLVLDFEATCEEHAPPDYLYEIIEFPVLLVDTHLQRVVAEFHSFVKPRYKAVLSDFCKALTGITQAQIDAAQPLEAVIRDFERWIAHTVSPHSRIIFATDGPTDLREFMYVHSVGRMGVRFPPLFYQWIDVKQSFAHFFQCPQGKIRAMLEVLNLPFEGRLHSGLDDARNIARIVIGLLRWHCTLCEMPLHRVPYSSIETPSDTSSPSKRDAHGAPC